jgi:very-short-patch-repair endonuclease
MPYERVNPFLRKAARSMRGRPTDVEDALWWRLRGRKLSGLKFRRQHPVGRYVADFVCLEAKLIVEADGAQHDPVADRVRSEDLFGLGFRVLRFSNERVRADIDAVCVEIVDVARQRLATPHPPAPQAPSPTRGEGWKRGEKG